MLGYEFTYSPGIHAGERLKRFLALAINSYYRKRIISFYKLLAMGRDFQ
jgi:hypothetical protein